MFFVAASACVCVWFVSGVVVGMDKARIENVYRSKASVGTECDVRVFEVSDDHELYHSLFSREDTNVYNVLEDIKTGSDVILANKKSFAIINQHVAKSKERNINNKWEVALCVGHAAKSKYKLEELCWQQAVKCSAEKFCVTPECTAFQYSNSGFGAQETIDFFVEGSTNFDKGWNSNAKGYCKARGHIKVESRAPFKDMTELSGDLWTYATECVQTGVRVPVCQYSAINSVGEAARMLSTPVEKRSGVREKQTPQQTIEQDVFLKKHKKDVVEKYADAKKNLDIGIHHAIEFGPSKAIYGADPYAMMVLKEWQTAYGLLVTQKKLSSTLSKEILKATEILPEVEAPEIEGWGDFVEGVGDHMQGAGAALAGLGAAGALYGAYANHKNLNEQRMNNLPDCLHLNTKAILGHNCKSTCKETGAKMGRGLAGTSIMIGLAGIAFAVLFPHVTVLLLAMKAIGTAVGILGMLNRHFTAAYLCKEYEKFDTNFKNIQPAELWSIEFGTQYDMRGNIGRFIQELKTDTESYAPPIFPDFEHSDADDAEAETYMYETYAGLYNVLERCKQKEGAWRERAQACIDEAIKPVEIEFTKKDDLWNSMKDKPSEKLVEMAKVDSLFKST